MIIAHEYDHVWKLGLYHWKLLHTRVNVRNGITLIYFGPFPVGLVPRDCALVPFTGPIHCLVWNISMSPGRMNTQNWEMFHTFQTYLCPNPVKKKFTNYVWSKWLFFWCLLVSKLLKQINQPHHLKPQEFFNWELMYSTLYTYYTNRPMYGCTGS